MSCLLKNIHRARFGLLSLLILCAAFFSCSDDGSQDADDDGGTPPVVSAACTPAGAITQCRCENGAKGTRQCRVSGAYTQCLCGSGSGAAGGSGGGSGGAGGVQAGAGGVQAGAGGVPQAGAGGVQAGAGGVPQAGAGGVQAGAGGVQAGAGGVQAGAGGVQAGAGGEVTGGSGGAPPTTSVDCNALPPLPITNANRLDHVPGAEDFTFDDEGFLVGVGTNDNALFRVPYSGGSEMLLPNVGTVGGGGGMGMMTVRGIRFLPNGDLVFADRGSGSIVRLNMSTYEKRPLASGLVEPNGLAIDMQGFVYATAMDGKVLRIDPDTGDSSVLFSEVVSLDGIAFAAGYERLYFNSEMGYVSYMPIYDDGTAGDWILAAELTAGFGGMLDGLTADECGNIYVVQMGGTIFRVSPDGQVETVVQLTGGGGGMGPMGFTINAVNFGSGIGGWKADAIYIISMGGGVREVVVGVQGTAQPHLQSRM